MSAVERSWEQPTPFGAVVVTLGPDGVRRVRWPHLDGDLSPPRDAGGALAGARSVARGFDAYFAGRTDVVDVMLDLDATPLSDLHRRLLMALRAEVPRGETVTYGELAELVGLPGRARAAGAAMARNPLPLIIPCHRVVAANGIGGYGGGAAGVALKRALLAFEARGRPTG